MIYFEPGLFAAQINEIRILLIGLLAEVRGSMTAECQREIKGLL